MRVRYYGPFGKPTGYAQAGHDYLAALAKAGVELDIWPMFEANDADLPERYHHLTQYLDRPDDLPTHIVVHTIPKYADVVLDDMGQQPEVPKTLITTWETTLIGRDTAEMLNGVFDLVVVPSEWNAEVFRQSGVERVCVVPHCYDPTAWPMSNLRPLRPYTFYTVGVFGERKNLMGLLRAYLTAFTAKDDVLLKICTPYVTTEDVQYLVQRIGLEDLPPVEFLGVGQRLTEKELWELHASSHCYVTATRGEAWGLGAFEAAIMGNPVISPGFGGHRDFLQHYSGWHEVPYQLTPAIADAVQVVNPITIGGFKIMPMAAGAPLGIAGDQSWAEPDLSYLQSLMRSLVNAPARQQHGHCRSFFDERFGYERVAKDFIQALERASAIHESFFSDDDKETA